MTFSYKLGKLPARKDIRTLKLSKLIPKIPVLPTDFDVDTSLGGLPDTHVYLNDTYGDCVIAGRAHMTLRFEDFEQKTVIPISDNDVKTEYFKETGGQDSGLVILDSLNAWRQGWPAAGHQYDIYAFASIDLSQQETQACMYLLRGCYAGFQVPQSAMDQFQAGQIWDVVPNDGGIAGGHCVYLVAYNTTGPICMTWGKRQPMTWPFYFKYFDEAYGIVDDKDSWVVNDPVVVTDLDNTLNDITGTPSQKISVLTISLPNGTVGVSYSTSLYAQGGTSPYTWAIVNGSLPGGLTMTGDGSISGTPTTAGTSGNMTFMVTDSVGNQSGIILTLTINNTPTPSTCKVGKGIANALNKVQKLRKRKGRFYYLNP